MVSPVVETQRQQQEQERILREQASKSKKRRGLQIVAATGAGSVGGRAQVAVFGPPEKSTEKGGIKVIQNSHQR